MKDDIRQFLRPVLNEKRTGQNIRHLMEVNGFSVRLVQSVFGFSYPQAVYAWLDGKNIPSIDNLLVLAKLFGVTIDEIVAYDEVCMDMEKSAQLKCARAWNHAGGGHWTERSEGSGWSESGMLERLTRRGAPKEENAYEK